VESSPLESPFPARHGTGGLVATRRRSVVVSLEVSGPRAYRFGVDDGVAPALAASNLSRLRSPALQRLPAGAFLVHVPAGSVTHREGESVEYLELVVDGLVRVFVTAPDGRSMTVRYARRGALIGVVSMYADGFRMPAGTQAVADATVLRLSPDIVRRAAAEDAHVADAWLHELADRVLSFVHEIPDSAFTSVRHRVARHLLDLASQESRAGRGARPGLTVPVSQRELADAVGSVREVVVRALRELRESGAISTHRDHIEILDPVRLSREQSGT
jgi:CRP/FNR family cyclic AMP-dependent transcriptional regulator